MMLEFTIDGIHHAVSVVRPLHPTDVLAVSYDADTIAIVLAYIGVLNRPGPVCNKYILEFAELPVYRFRFPFGLNRGL